VKHEIDRCLDRSTLWGPSGGLVWHARAIRYRAHWRGFLDALDRWLAGWVPGHKDLILVGPSAGWCLPDRFLSRFDRIRVIDLDPLAHAGFILNHGSALRRARVNLIWERGDFWSRLHAGNLSEAGTAILFCNLLGQHALHRRDPATARYELEGLSARLHGIDWATFHDRLSATWHPGFACPDAFTTEEPIDNLTLASRTPACRSWSDHLTEGLMPGCRTRWFLPWMLHPLRFHWVEAGFVDA
jgi:hypothetical protein